MKRFSPNSRHDYCVADVMSGIEGRGGIGSRPLKPEKKTMLIAYLPEQESSRVKRKREVPRNLQSLFMPSLMESANGSPSDTERKKNHS